MIGSDYKPFSHEDAKNYFGNNYAKTTAASNDPNRNLALHTVALVNAEEAWANELQVRWNQLYKQFKSDIDAMISAAGGEEFVTVNSFGPTFRDLVLEVACPPTSQIAPEEPVAANEVDDYDRNEKCCGNPADCEQRCELAEADVAALGTDEPVRQVQTLLEKLLLDLESNPFVARHYPSL